MKTLSVRVLKPSAGALGLNASTVCIGTCASAQARAHHEVVARCDHHPVAPGGGERHNLSRSIKSRS